MPNTMQTRHQQHESKEKQNRSQCVLDAKHKFVTKTIRCQKDKARKMATK